jgi:O-antigen/teichoic acid export membrane protein
LLAVIVNIRTVIQTAGFAWIYFFYTGPKAVLPYLFVNAGAIIVGGVVGAFFIRNHINLAFLQFRKLNLKLYLKISLKFYLTEIVTFFSTKGVATLVAAKLAIANLAYFNMMFNHFNMLRFPNNALGTMMFPLLSKETSEKKQRVYISNKIRFNFLIYPPILIAAYLLYPKLVILFYGPEYETITHYFPYILLIGAPYLIIYPICHYFSANGAPQYDGYIKLFSLLIQITGVLLFFYFNNFSLFSAVLSQALGFVGFTIALLLIYKYKRFNISTS